MAKSLAKFPVENYDQPSTHKGAPVEFHERKAALADQRRLAVAEAERRRADKKEKIEADLRKKSKQRAERLAAEREATEVANIPETKEKYEKMAGARVSNNDQLAYMEVQAADATINNTGGTADVAAGDAVRIASLNLDNQKDRIDSRNKTGSRSRNVGITGRRRGPWSVDMDLNPSGTLGTVPDSDPLIQAAFGQASTAGSGTVSVTGAADNGSGIVRITATSHGLSTGDTVVIDGVVGTTEANGFHRAVVNDANTFDLYGVAFA